ncbi:MAG: hypothetical protein MHM6MM_003492 [Cercozoa sp. M6MM]
MALYRILVVLVRSGAALVPMLLLATLCSSHRSQEWPASMPGHELYSHVNVLSEHALLRKHLQGELRPFASLTDRNDTSAFGEQRRSARLQQLNRAELECAGAAFLAGIDLDVLFLLSVIVGESSNNTISFEQCQLQMCQSQIPGGNVVPDSMSLCLRGVLVFMNRRFMVNARMLVRGGDTIEEMFFVGDFLSAVGGTDQTICGFPFDVFPDFICRNPDGSTSGIVVVQTIEFASSGPSAGLFIDGTAEVFGLIQAIYAELFDDDTLPFNTRFKVQGRFTPRLDLTIRSDINSTCQQFGPAAGAMVMPTNATRSLARQQFMFDSLMLQFRTENGTFGQCWGAFVHAIANFRFDPVKEPCNALRMVGTARASLSAERRIFSMNLQQWPLVGSPLYNTSAFPIWRPPSVVNARNQSVRPLVSNLKSIVFFDSMMTPMVSASLSGELRYVDESASQENTAVFALRAYYNQDPQTLVWLAPEDRPTPFQVPVDFDDSTGAYKNKAQCVLPSIAFARRQLEEAPPGGWNLFDAPQRFYDEGACKYPWYMITLGVFLIFFAVATLMLAVKLGATASAQQRVGLYAVFLAFVAAAVLTFVFGCFKTDVGFVITGTASTDRAIRTMNTTLQITLVGPNWARFGVRPDIALVILRDGFVGEAGVRKFRQQLLNNEEQVTVERTRITLRLNRVFNFVSNSSEAISLPFVPSELIAGDHRAYQVRNEEFFIRKSDIDVQQRETVTSNDIRTARRRNNDNSAALLQANDPVESKGRLDLACEPRYRSFDEAFSVEEWKCSVGASGWPGNQQLLPADLGVQVKISSFQPPFEGFALMTRNVSLLNLTKEFPTLDSYMVPWFDAHFSSNDSSGSIVSESDIVFLPPPTSGLRNVAQFVFRLPRRLRRVVPFRSELQLQVRVAWRDPASTPQGGLVAQQRQLRVPLQAVSSNPVPIGNVPFDNTGLQELGLVQDVKVNTVRVKSTHEPFEVTQNQTEHYPGFQALAELVRFNLSENANRTLRADPNVTARNANCTLSASLTQLRFVITAFGEPALQDVATTETGEAPNSLERSGGASSAGSSAVSGVGDGSMVGTGSGTSQTSTSASSLSGEVPRPMSFRSLPFYDPRLPDLHGFGAVVFSPSRGMLQLNEPIPGLDPRIPVECGINVIARLSGDTDAMRPLKSMSPGASTPSLQDFEDMRENGSIINNPTAIMSNERSFESRIFGFVRDDGVMELEGWLRDLTLGNGAFEMDRMRFLLRNRNPFIQFDTTAMARPGLMGTPPINDVLAITANGSNMSMASTQQLLDAQARLSQPQNDSTPSTDQLNTALKNAPSEAQIEALQKSLRQSFGQATLQVFALDAFLVKRTSDAVPIPAWAGSDRYKRSYVSQPRFGASNIFSEDEATLGGDGESATQLDRNALETAPDFAADPEAAQCGELTAFYNVSVLLEVNKSNNMAGMTENMRPRPNLDTGTPTLIDAASSVNLPPDLGQLTIFGQGSYDECPGSGSLVVFTLNTTELNVNEVVRLATESNATAGVNQPMPSQGSSRGRLRDITIDALSSVATNFLRLFVGGLHRLIVWAEPKRKNLLFQADIVASDLNYHVEGLVNRPVDPDEPNAATKMFIIARPLSSYDVGQQSYFPSGEAVGSPSFTSPVIAYSTVPTTALIPLVPVSQQNQPSEQSAQEFVFSQIDIHRGINLALFRSFATDAGLVREMVSRQSWLKAIARITSAGTFQFRAELTTPVQFKENAAVGAPSVFSIQWREADMIEPAIPVPSPVCAELAPNSFLQALGPPSMAGTKIYRIEAFAFMVFEFDSFIFFWELCMVLRSNSAFLRAQACGVPKPGKFQVPRDTGFNVYEGKQLVPCQSDETCNDATNATQRMMMSPSAGSPLDPLIAVAREDYAKPIARPRKSLNATGSRLNEPIPRRFLNEHVRCAPLPPAEGSTKYCVPGTYTITLISANNVIRPDGRAPSVNEATADSIIEVEIRLMTPPAEEVLATPRDSLAALTFSPASVSFTSSDWQRPKRVRGIVLPGISWPALETTLVTFMLTSATRLSGSMLGFNRSFTIDDFFVPNTQGIPIMLDDESCGSDGSADTTNAWKACSGSICMLRERKCARRAPTNLLMSATLRSDTPVVGEDGFQVYELRFRVPVVPTDNLMIGLGKEGCPSPLIAADMSQVNFPMQRFTLPRGTRGFFGALNFAIEFGSSFDEMTDTNTMETVQRLVANLTALRSQLEALNSTAVSNMSAIVTRNARIEKVRWESIKEARLGQRSINKDATRFILRRLWHGDAFEDDRSGSPRFQTTNQTNGTMGTGVEGIDISTLPAGERMLVLQADATMKEFEMAFTNILFGLPSTQPNFVVAGRRLEGDVTGRTQFWKVRVPRSEFCPSPSFPTDGDNIRSCVYKAWCISTSGGLDWTRQAGLMPVKVLTAQRSQIELLARRVAKLIAAGQVSCSPAQPQYEFGFGEFKLTYLRVSVERQAHKFAGAPVSRVTGRAPTASSVMAKFEAAFTFFSFRFELVVRYSNVPYQSAFGVSLIYNGFPPNKVLTMAAIISLLTNNALSLADTPILGDILTFWALLRAQVFVAFGAAPGGQGTSFGASVIIVTYDAKYRQFEERETRALCQITADGVRRCGEFDPRKLVTEGILDRLFFFGMISGPDRPDLVTLVSGPVDGDKTWQSARPRLMSATEKLQLCPECTFMDPVTLAVNKTACTLCQRDPTRWRQNNMPPPGAQPIVTPLDFNHPLRLALYVRQFRLSTIFGDAFSFVDFLNFGKVVMGYINKGVLPKQVVTITFPDGFKHQFAAKARALEFAMYLGGNSDDPISEWVNELGVKVVVSGAVYIQRTLTIQLNFAVAKTRNDDDMTEHGTFQIVSFVFTFEIVVVFSQPVPSASLEVALALTALYEASDKNTLDLFGELRLRIATSGIFLIASVESRDEVVDFLGIKGLTLLPCGLTFGFPIPNIVDVRYRLGVFCGARYSEFEISLALFFNSLNPNGLIRAPAGVDVVMAYGLVNFDLKELIKNIIDFELPFELSVKKLQYGFALSVPGFIPISFATTVWMSGLFLQATEFNLFDFFKGDLYVRLQLLSRGDPSNEQPTQSSQGSQGAGQILSAIGVPWPFLLIMRGGFERIQFFIFELSRAPVNLVTPIRRLSMRGAKVPTCEDLTTQARNNATLRFEPTTERPCPDPITFLTPQEVIAILRERGECLPFDEIYYTGLNFDIQISPDLFKFRFSAQAVAKIGSIELARVLIAIRIDNTMNFFLLAADILGFKVIVFFRAAVSLYEAVLNTVQGEPALLIIVAAGSDINVPSMMAFNDRAEDGPNGGGVNQMVNNEMKGTHDKLDAKHQQDESDSNAHQADRRNKISSRDGLAQERRLRSVDAIGGAIGATSTSVFEAARALEQKMDQLRESLHTRRLVVSRIDDAIERLEWQLEATQKLHSDDFGVASRLQHGYLVATDRGRARKRADSIRRSIERHEEQRWQELERVDDDRYELQRTERELANLLHSLCGELSKNELRELYQSMRDGDGVADCGAGSS